MLIEFRLENFRSYRQEQTLSLVAGNVSELPEHKISAGGMELLRSACIYGANASGKSNLFKAMDFMRKTVLRSAETKRRGEFGIFPFLLDAESSGKPSGFEVVFLIEDFRYQYGFKVTRKRVEEEWLFATPLKTNTGRLWFERHVDPDTGQANWRWGPSFKGEKNRLAKLTRPDTLFLSAAYQFNHEQLTPLYKWFENVRVINSPRNLRPITAMMLDRTLRDPEGWRDIRDWIVGIVENADLGITEVSAQERELPEPEFPKGMPDEVRQEILTDLKESVGFDVKVAHENPETRKDVVFSMEDESGGTQCFFNLAGPWLEALTFGYVVFVDEIETNLHPMLTRELVKLFLDPEINREGGQLIFATHDTTLLDPTLLRRDEIWFTEKDTGAATRLYPLSDYEARKGEALQKGYLSGRYGAVPILKAFQKYGAKSKE